MGEGSGVNGAIRVGCDKLSLLGEEEEGGTSKGKSGKTDEGEEDKDKGALGGQAGGVKIKTELLSC